MGLPPSSSDEESQHYWTMLLVLVMINDLDDWIFYAPPSQEEPFVRHLLITV